MSEHMKKKQSIFDDPKNVRRFRTGFFIVCGLLLLPDLFIHKHGDYKWEEWPGFHAAFGFVACVVLVLVAKYILRPIVERKEDYYD